MTNDKQTNMSACFPNPTHRTAAYVRTFVLYCIGLGGLKFTGLTKTTYSAYDKGSSCRNPDYPRTIDAKGCPKASDGISKLQISLIWGFSYIQTNKLQLSTLHGGALWYRISLLLRRGKTQYNAIPRSLFEKHLLEGQIIIIIINVAFDNPPWRKRLKLQRRNGCSARLLHFCDGFLLGCFDGLDSTILAASCLAISMTFLSFSDKFYMILLAFLRVSC